MGIPGCSTNSPLGPGLTTDMDNWPAWSFCWITVATTGIFIWTVLPPAFPSASGKCDYLDTNQACRNLRGLQYWPICRHTLFNKRLRSEKIKNKIIGCKYVL